MEHYPTDYVVHNLPLVLLSGLEDERRVEPDLGDKARPLLSEGGFSIRTDAEPIRGDLASALVEELLSHDASTAPWNSKSASTEAYGRAYKIKLVNRVGQRPFNTLTPYLPSRLGCVAVVTE